jgi:hypothetical protein
MISNTDLTENDIPKPNARWRRDIDFFALSYDGEHDKNRADIANATRDAFEKNKQLPESLTLTDLRTCLYTEQRRWRHFGIDPDDKTMVYIYSLVETIRQKVRLKQLD